MKLLDFPKGEKRDTPLNMRVPKTTLDKLKKISEKYGVSQSRVVERLIDVAYSEMPNHKKKD